MAAFSSIFEQPQQQAFLLDSNSMSTINCNINICALLEEPNNANFVSSTFYIQPQNLDHSTPPNNDSSSSSDHLIHSLTNNKNSMDSSSIVTHHYKYDHNWLTTTPVDNKRKSKHPSTCPNSAQPKAKREVKGKKQKKMKDNAGEEKSKSSKEEEEEKKAAAGYIHVRARRGQATDSHSLAERVRRERISERMKLLQGLVPGCDKVTGKALMLDEIINYVQSLQNQVEFLSMKLACLNPILYDSGMDLESLMVRAEDHQPLPSMQESSPTTASNYHHLLQNSAHSILFPHEPQIPNVLPHLQGSRQGLWELDEHTQRSIMNQSAGFTNTFFSFH